LFKKILIANRGEIAVRILRACHELGIQVVAVYSEIDRGALHVRYADEAYPLDGETAEETYLSRHKILKIARESKVDAIHPGYGFLAEDGALADECLKAGIVFIGPSGESLETMGKKLLAKSKMAGALIPVIPGSKSPLEDGAEAREVAEEIGYPVLIKAIAGGGGKGIRRVDRPEKLSRAIETARAEAMTAFGSNELYLEKYISGARHIEFQVLADQHGNVIHLFDRECSIQRRYQKILEECPSPFLDDTTRLRMAGVALSAAMAIQYTGAGTVEFLVDREKKFYYLELNARLQVEHPVTEMVTGVDIVKSQIRIAEGERLSLTQQEVHPLGASLVCRIYAEDPENNFLPSTGRIDRLQIPGGPGVRVDMGVYEGWTIPLFYDPIIAKVIVWGANRREALLRMDRALQEFVIKGIKTTIPFHRWLVNNQRFIEGDFDTTFVEREYLRRQDRRDGFQEIAFIAAAIKAYQGAHGKKTLKYEVKAGGKTEIAQVEGLGPSLYQISFPNHQDHRVDVFEISENLYSLICEGQSYEVDIVESGKNRNAYQVFLKGTSYTIEVAGPGERPSPPTEEGILYSPGSPKESVHEESVFSPMTCTVARILVRPGEEVQRDQELLLTEAMKLEMPIPSPGHGTVKEILVREGETVDQGTKLVSLILLE